MSLDTLIEQKKNPYLKIYCGPPAWGLFEVLTAPQRKPVYFTNYSQTKPRTSTHSLVRTKQRKKDMRFGTWNVRSRYRADSLTAATRELAR